MYGGIMNHPDYEMLRQHHAALPIEANMMNTPLRVTDLMARAEELFPQREILTRNGTGSIERSDYARVGELSRRLAAGLVAVGTRPGERIATLMWNHATHLASYFAAPAIDAVLHPLNPRLSPEEVAYIVADAGDRVVLVDEALLPFWREVERYVSAPLVFVHGTTQGYGRLEDLLMHAPLAQWPRRPVDEHGPVSICYTSGTTGRSKGVVYSHRSIILHGLGVSLPDILGLSSNDTIFTLTPMFHVNGWGMPYTITMLGARHILPGPHITPEEILDMMQNEQVNVAFGVPTIWTAVLNQLDAHPGRWRLHPGLRLYSGGAAPPAEMFRRFDQLGIRLQAGWGMTETSPVATQAWLTRELRAEDESSQMKARTTGGLPLPLIDMRIVDDAGKVLPWDDQAKGELQVRGPWIAESYIGHPEPVSACTEDGWLKTGDIACIRPDGYLRLVDRLKDLVKSGGEWISSIDMENALMSHPDVYEAAVIAIPDAHWGERPLAIVKLKPERQTEPDSIRNFLLGRFPHWMAPDRIEVVAELPKTSVGKLNKRLLREYYVK
ncbi:MAG: fatty-acid--CoA ligase [Gammaproteobacteria bacterium]|nr:MAG: fatty-acid--CoA ligase [Gammaproteobacteria bacterium]